MFITDRLNHRLNFKDMKLTCQQKAPTYQWRSSLVEVAKLVHSTPKKKRIGVQFLYLVSISLFNFHDFFYFADFFFHSFIWSAMRPSHPKSEEGVSVKYADTRRLHPRPYLSKGNGSNQITLKKEAASLSTFDSSSFSHLDRYLSSSSSLLNQKPLPEYLWKDNFTGSPSGITKSVFLAEKTLVAIFFANKLQVYNTSTCTRLYEYVFEDENGDQKVFVTFLHLIVFFCFQNSKLTFFKKSHFLVANH